MRGPEELEILRPVGADEATFVARETSGQDRRLIVIERVTRASPVPAARAELLRRGRALRALEHPKVVRVRDVFERDTEVVVVSDYVDGEWLSALMAMNPSPPMGILLRLVVDVLEGLAALHGLRDEGDKALGFVHGAVSPDTILVADDGVAEIARACRLPRPGSNERYVAPELRRGAEPATLGADVYAAGAILRDVLAGATAEASWAESLTDTAWRACSVDTENRWPSAAAMATAVRRIAGTKLATAATVAEFMRKSFGKQMQARRAALDPSDPTPSSTELLSLRSSEMMEVAEPSGPSMDDTAIAPPPRMPPGPPPPVRTSTKPSVSPERSAVAKAPPAKVDPPRDSEDESEPATMRRFENKAEPPEVVPAPASSSVLVSGPPPPPTINPIEPTRMSDTARRRLPTFPIIEPEPKGRGALQGTIIALAMMLMFGLGLLLGRGKTLQPEAPAESPNVAPQSIAVAPPPVALTTTTATAAIVAPPTATTMPSASVATVDASTSATASTAAAVVASVVLPTPSPVATSDAGRVAAPIPVPTAHRPVATVSATASAGAPTPGPTATATASAASKAPSDRKAPTNRVESNPEEL